MQLSKTRFFRMSLVRCTADCNATIAWPWRLWAGWCRLIFFNLKFFGGPFCFTPPDALEIKAWPFRAAEHYDPYRKFFKNVIASR